MPKGNGHTEIGSGKIINGSIAISVGKGHGGWINWQRLGNVPAGRWYSAY